LGPRIVLGVLAIADVLAMIYAQLTLPRRGGVSLPAVHGPASS
jgi:hypothetical protein